MSVLAERFFICSHSKNQTDQETSTKSLRCMQLLTSIQQCDYKLTVLKFHRFLHGFTFAVFVQKVTKICRLSWLTNGALAYEPKCGGRGGYSGFSANAYSIAQRVQINFGDLTPYVTYDSVILKKISSYSFVF
jgi:hypothetical protein